MDRPSEVTATASGERATCSANNTGTDTGAGAGCGQNRAVADLVQPGVLTGIEHIDRRQPQIDRGEPPVGVGGHRRQHPLQPLDQCFDAGGVEHIGAELHRPPDTGRLTGIGEVFGQRERQIHAGGVGVDRHLRDLQIPQRQPGGAVVSCPGKVLPGQQHLHQRMMRQRPGRVEPLHQHLERHILMLEGGQAAPPHLGQQARRTVGSPARSTRNTSVLTKNPTSSSSAGSLRPAIGNPTATSAAGAEPRQQHRQGGLHHHEAGRVVLARPPRAPAAATRPASPPPHVAPR